MTHCIILHIATRYASVHSHCQGIELIMFFSLMRSFFIKLFSIPKTILYVRQPNPKQQSIAHGQR